jgi:2,4-diketo-3-deoxy-L-fuconate hydrolase
MPLSFKPTVRRMALATGAGVAMAYALAMNMTEPAPVSPHSSQPGATAAPAADGVRIAPLSDALTFTRFRVDGRLRLMRVERYEDGVVSGTDITALQASGEADPITLWNQSSYEVIAAAGGLPVSVQATELAVPFASNGVQIAMGGTYPDHAKETSMARPFAFPKLQPAHRWDMDVPAHAFLLDHEIELGFVALEPLEAGRPARHFGLVLASDYTDRDRLLRDIGTSDVNTGLAFAAAKSIVPAMPVGALFVIPRDVRSFYKTLDLRLHVNDRLRQVAQPKNLAWELDRMVDESIARRGMAFPMGRGHVRLPIGSDGLVPQRTILLSGTTDGVVVRPPSARQLFVGVAQWLVSLRWTTPGLIVEPTVREAHADGHFLQPGDQVVMRADYLGVISNKIVP